MYTATAVLGCLLLGQTPADHADPPNALRPPIVSTRPAQLNPPETFRPITRGSDEPIPRPALPFEKPEAGLSDPPATLQLAELPRRTEPARLRPTPPEMVAEALTLSAESCLSGSPMTLLDALSHAADRAQQIEVVYAYWRLAEAVGTVRHVESYDAQLRRLTSHVADDPLVRTAEADSAADVQDAELQAVTVQHELAVLARLPFDAPLPLPADRPHVGPYRTSFDQLFSRRSPPARARLLDRTLPIRCHAIDRLASAVHASEDALEAAVEARADLPTVLACMKRRQQQQQAFIEAVCRYNREISDYALAVAGSGANAQALVTMLIKPSRSRLQPLASEIPTIAIPANPLRAEPSRVEAAGHDRAVPTLAVPTRPVPTRAVPTRAVRPKNVPTLAPPRPDTLETPDTASETKKWEPLRKEESEPPLEPIPHTTYRPADETRLDTVEGQPSASAIHAPLAGAAPDRRAEQLAATLHWDRTLPENVGKPIGLADCLRSGPPSNRLDTIGAFWTVRQHAAQYQALVQQADWIHAMTLAGPLEPVESALLQSAAHGTDAALLEQQVELIEAQFELAVYLGSTADPVWPLPTDTPHAGSYRAISEGHSAGRPISWQMRRLRATIPGFAESIRRRATAVIAADAARAEPRDDELRPALADMDRQTQQTFAFLKTLTAYNRAIAEHALAVHPSDGSEEDFLAALLPQR